jgi:hypothetical protein
MAMAPWRRDQGGEAIEQLERGEHEQTWIDSSAQALFIDGNFEDESLVLTGQTGEGPKHTFHRITWTPISGGVRQHWEQSKDGKAWKSVFDGRYERTGGQ